MKNSKTKIIISIMLIIVLLLSVSIPIFGVNVSSDNALSGEKVYFNATLDENFAGDSVIVVINKTYSKKNIQFNSSDFSNLQVKNIKSLTTSIEGLSEKKSIDDEHTMKLTNFEEFRQIIKIELNGNSKQNVLSTIKKLEKLDFVESAFPDYYESVASTAPNDTRYYDQWALSKIKAPNAWDITTGSVSIKVGIIDSGISSHTDLNANVVTGRDLFHDNSTTTDDTHGHGTLISGIVGAVGNNNTGVCGINWRVSLVPLQIVSDNNEFLSSAIISAINYARINNIPIINCSFGSYRQQNPYEAVMRNYTGVIVCAAGNEGNNTDNNLHFPSCSTLDNIISVGASNNNDQRATGWANGDSSNWGAMSVDLFAPGDSILTTKKGNAYTNEYSGTSLAAPYVAGVAALIKSVRPELTAEQIKYCLMAGVDEVVALRGLCVSNGRLNARNALDLVSGIPADTFISGDFDGDDIDDIARFSYTGPYSMKIYVTEYSSQEEKVWNTQTSYVYAKIVGRIAAGDFNGDGKDDIATMYAYPDGSTQIHIFKSTGASFVSSSWNTMRAGAYSADRVTGRFVAGDFTGDGKGDIAAMYAYPDGKTQIHVFKSTGTAFTEAYTWFAPGSYDANKVTNRFDSGDFNGDGRCDIAAMYAYPDGSTQIHVFNSTGTTFSGEAWLIMNPGSYNADKVTGRFSAGDFDRDGKDDIAAMYAYPDGSTQIHVFKSTGTALVGLTWNTIRAGAYLPSRVTGRFLAGDFVGDEKVDIAAVYYYPEGYTNIHAFESTGVSFKEAIIWRVRP